MTKKSRRGLVVRVWPGVVERRAWLAHTTFGAIVRVIAGNAKPRVVCSFRQSVLLATNLQCVSAGFVNEQSPSGLDLYVGGHRCRDVS